MPYEPTYRRRVSVTLLRATASVVGLSVALLAAGGLNGRLGALDPFGSLGVLSAFWWFATLIPLGWAVLGGAVLDHILARRGPWWPMFVHPMGLTVVGVMIALVLGVKGVVTDGSPVAFLSVIFVAPVPFIGIAGVFATWLIPGSFPAYVPQVHVRSVAAPPGYPS